MEENKVATREKLLSILNLHYSHEGAADAILQSPDLRVTLVEQRFHVERYGDTGCLNVLDRKGEVWLVAFQPNEKARAQQYADWLNSKEPK